MWALHRGQDLAYDSLDVERDDNLYAEMLFRKHFCSRALVEAVNKV
jgi:hypothetical protein